MLRSVSRSVGAARSKWPLSPRRGARGASTFLLNALGTHRALSRILGDVRAVSAVEFALIAPVMLGIGTGMLKFGVALSHYVVLTNAAAQGAMALALSRGAASSYSAVTTAVALASPNLNTAQITQTVKINGTACTTDAGCAALMAAGATAWVRTTYPCDLTVLGFNFKSGCTLSAQAAQMVQ